MSLVQSQIWKFQVNNTFPNIGNATTSTRNFIYALKEAFFKSNGSWTDSDGYSSTAPDVGGWVVEGSGTGNSDSAMDGIDRWTSASALFTDTTHKPWIVFSNPAIHPTLQIVLGWGGTTSAIQQIVCYSSFIGFSSPPANSRPTAADEISMLHTNTNGDIGTTTTGASFIAHFLKTEDGYHSRCVICRDGIVSGYFSLEVPQNISGWASPLLVTQRGTAATTPTNQLNYNDFSGFSSSTFPSIGNSIYGSIPVIYTGEGTDSGLLASISGTINEISSSYAAYPVGFYAPSIVKGKMGNPLDLWWASSNVPNGSTYPGDGTKQFAQFGNMIFPWNKTTPLLL